MTLILVDFYSLGCSPANRRRLAKIYLDVQSENAVKATAKRLRLCNWLVSSACDWRRGLYTPLSNTVRVAGKFTDPSITPQMMAAPVDEHFYTYFTNALVLPQGHDQPDFDVRQAPAPLDRLTNAGWIVATVEFDWESVAEFDRNLDWFAGKDGDFTVAPFWEVHRELQRHHDYRGFCAVHSGRVSVHHIIYMTPRISRGRHTTQTIRHGLLGVKRSPQ